MPDARQPIKIKRIPGGFAVDGRKLWIYKREPDEFVCSADRMTMPEAETLAKDVARALAALWGGIR